MSYTGIWSECLARRGAPQRPLDFDANHCANRLLNR
jgi:hypothetical protein